ncbi:hypothetical protein HKD37_11G032080 [Glycine soja]
MTLFVLIGCGRSGQYRSRKKDFVRKDTRSRKYGCPFKLSGKPVVGGQGWMVKLMYGIHNHELAKSLVGHPYAERLTKDEKTIIVDITKSMVKPRNILLTLKEHNANSYSTYKTNRYRLPLLDFVGVRLARMTFSVGFAYLKGERVNNVVWALERFRGFTSTRMSRQNVNQVESAHWTLKRVLQNSLGDLCSVWDAMNNMIILQNIEIKVSFETSTHVVGYVFKVTLYKRLLGMVSRYALNQIGAEFEHVHYPDKNPSPCDQGLSEPEVTIKEEIGTISKRFEELDVCGKFTLKSKLREIAYPDQNSMCHPPAKVNTKGDVNLSRSGSFDIGYEDLDDATSGEGR